MSGQVPREKIDEILTSTDIVSLIEEHVALKRAGRNFKGLCPFHDEKSPSFMVSPDKQIYHCFGCGEGGNAIGFVMKVENLSFRDTLIKLAGKAGIRLVFDEKKEVDRDEKDIFYKINRYASWFFRECLKSPSGEKARSYLVQRGLSESTIENFQLGMAPDSWEALTQFLTAKKAPLKAAEKLGLLRLRTDGSAYDFFRNRIMFPILDHEGRCLGFSGRTLSSQADEAKYINSPESPIYHKGGTIFGQYQSHRAIREKNSVIIVEGNIDVIQMHQAGFTNTVAPLGTALTTGQVRHLKRATPHFFLMLDGDSAGVKATRRALPLFFENGLHPRLLQLPRGEDPDSFLRKNGQHALASFFEQAPKAMDWLFNEELKGTNSQERTEGAKQVMEYISTFQDKLEKDYYQKKLSEIVGINFQALTTSPKRPVRRDEPTFSKPAPSPRLQKNSKNSVENIILALYLKAPHQMDPHVSEDMFEKFDNKTLGKLGCEIQRTFRSTGNLAVDRLIETLSPDEKSYLTVLSMDPFLEMELGEQVSEIILDNLIEDSLNALRKKILKDEMKRLTREVRLAEMSGDNQRMATLLSEMKQITTTLKN